MPLKSGSAILVLLHIMLSSRLKWTLLNWHHQLHPTIKMSHNGIWFPVYFNFDITDWKKSLLLISFIQMLHLFARTPASISFVESSLRHCSLIVSHVRPITLTVCKNTVQMSESLK
jgi:hypothetical protein